MIPSEPPPPRRRELLRGAAAVGGLLAVAAPRRSAARTAAARRAMWNPRRHLRRGPGRTGEPELPPLGVVAHARMAFGHAPGDLDAFEALGSTDGERLTAFIQQQLDDYELLDDSDLEARLAAGGFTTLGKTREQLWTEHMLVPDDPVNWYQPLSDLTMATLMRQTYSKRQLLEVIVDFWHNHFNICGSDVAPMMVHQDRDVLRPHALGSFRDLLGAVAASPSMLLYLDGAVNTKDGTPNENYARELMDVHTLGSEHYFGTILQSDVPDEDGEPLGYVDADVLEAARCFTGWTLDPATGAFLFDASKHDDGSKHFMGVEFPIGQGVGDGEQVLDMVASHQATARTVAFKLARRLLADDPPDSLVLAAEDVFLSLDGQPDQITEVVRTILSSDAFRDTFGEKVKRPTEAVVSALRGGGGELTLVAGDLDSLAFVDGLGAAGQRPFGHPLPDGYPDTAEPWLSTTPKAIAWKLANTLISTPPDGDPPVVDVVAQTPADVRSSNELVDFWVDRVLGRPVDAETREELVDFMAQGVNADFDLDLDDPDVQSRLASLVGLLFMTPDFLWR